MGYGRRAMNLLIQYYEGKIPSLAEELKEDGQISTLTGDEVKWKVHQYHRESLKVHLKKIVAQKVNLFIGQFLTEGKIITST